MGILKLESKIKKMEKRMKSYETSNPEMAKKIKGKIAGLRGKHNKKK